MNTFEDKLHASAHRLVKQYNRKMHVPQNPLQQKRTYWGWVATPAVAVVGLIFGMSVHLFMENNQDDQLAQQVDTIRIFQPIHDTLYLTQVVEKEKIVYKQAKETKREEPLPVQEETEAPTCTSIQCDGINYSILASY